MGTSRELVSGDFKRQIEGLTEAVPISFLAPFRDQRGWAFTRESFSDGPGGEYVDAVHGSAAGLDLYPAELRREIDAINKRVYAINNGVHRAGFARRQDAYPRARLERLIAAGACRRGRFGSLHSPSSSRLALGWSPPPGSDGATPPRAWAPSDHRYPSRSDTARSPT